MHHFSPKQEFLKSQEAGEHRELVVRPSFRAALNLAMLEFQKRMNDLDGADINGSGAMFQRLTGARQYVEILLNLGEQVDIPVRKDTGNLNHSA